MDLISYKLNLSNPNTKSVICLNLKLLWYTYEIIYNVNILNENLSS